MIRILALTLCVVLLFSGCAEPEPQDPLADWLASANLGAEETPEQLYAAALEEDMLVIYSTSTRMMDVAKSFEQEYPGLVARVEHLREGELNDRMRKNYEAGDFACDVIYTADGQGTMVNEFLPKSMVVKYVPYDIADKILPGNSEDLLMLTGEATVLTYCGEYYNEPPVSNWWELTEEKWRGMVYMPNPMRSTTTLVLLNTIIKESDMMAKAYEDFYGKPLALPEGESAGREFVRRFVGNGLNIVNSSDETAAEVGYPDAPGPAVGIIVSSKTRLRDIGYTITNHYDMEPFCGIYTPNAIMMAGGARNVNAAKLFIRWVLGETDGQGEGYRPYLQSGAWTVRSDVRDDTGVRSEELNLLPLDKKYVYENSEAFVAFWQELIESRT